MNRIDLDDDDVVDLEKASSTLGANSTCKGSELIAAIRKKYTVQNDGRILPDFNFFDKGVICRFLSHKEGGWQSGRLRFRLEFIPDTEPEGIKPESPLDYFPQD